MLSGSCIPQSHFAALVRQPPLGKGANGGPMRASAPTSRIALFTPVGVDPQIDPQTPPSVQFTFSLDRPAYSTGQRADEGIGPYDADRPVYARRGRSPDRPANSPLQCNSPSPQIDPHIRRGSGPMRASAPTTRIAAFTRVGATLAVARVPQYAILRPVRRLAEGSQIRELVPYPAFEILRLRRCAAALRMTRRGGLFFAP